VSEVTRHYNELLAAHYSWMSGMPFGAKVAEQQTLLADLELAGAPKGLAVDLGCGPGYQSFALANLGFEPVLAIDTSRDLLEELEAKNADHRINVLLADMRAFSHFVQPGAANVIICMGDTLTHLENYADISKLFLDAYNALAPDGRFVLTFRDFSTELRGIDRFIPVRADDDRIMLCVLDYEPENVVVTDVVHVRCGGEWTLRKSSYRKLRLSPASLIVTLDDIGFMIDHNRSAGRMHAISARKASS
jgi:SAM-dependent methyltransferase